MSLRTRAWEILQPAVGDDRISRVFDFSILALIFLNVAASVIGTVPSVYAVYGDSLDLFEVLSVAVFTVEYVGRIWSCVTDPGFSKPLSGRLRYAMRPMSIIDLLAIVPFYLPFLGVDMRIVRILRLLRILRVAKIGRYNQSLQLMQRVVTNKREELVLTFGMMLMLLVLSASAMYYIENEVQPDVFTSIPATLWWSVMTLTTVGYGDVYPVTAMGKVVAAIISILGIGLVALPTGVLGAGYVEEIQKHKRRAGEQCPHCGGSLHEPG